VNEFLAATETNKSKDFLHEFDSAFTRKTNALANVDRLSPMNLGAFRVWDRSYDATGVQRSMMQCEDRKLLQIGLLSRSHVGGWTIQLNV
jgi:hypothetical protein